MPVSVLCVETYFYAPQQYLNAIEANDPFSNLLAMTYFCTFGRWIF